MAVKSYKDLRVWKKSMDLTFDVYEKVKSFPKEELYGLTGQMRRAVVSIPSNIAEGNQRDTTKEYIHFLYMARGSLAELETQIMMCERFGYLGLEDIEVLNYQCAEVLRMLNALIARLQQLNNEKKIQQVKE